MIFSERATGTDEFYTDGDAGRIRQSAWRELGAQFLSQYLQAKRAIDAGIKTLDDYGGVMPGEMPSTAGDGALGQSHDRILVRYSVPRNTEWVTRGRS